MDLTDKSLRPRIRIEPDSFDMIVEFVSVIFLIFLIVIPLRYYGSLPEKIPTHFDGSGTPDGYGSKSTLWLLPAIGFILWIGITILVRFPHIFNYPVQITAENAETQYRLATRLMRILKTVILIMFTFISYMTIKTALGTAGGLGTFFLPVFLVLTFGVIIIYFVRANRKTRSQD